MSNTILGDACIRASAVPAQSAADKFWTIYEKHLAALAAQGAYAWPAENASNVAGKMRAAWYKGSGSKDGPAFKATCKELGISQTYKAMRAYIAGIELPTKLTIAGPNGMHKVDCYARFDYACGPYLFGMAVTHDINLKGLNKCITHVASSLRVCSLSVNAEDLPAFAACKTDEERARVCLKVLERKHTIATLSARLYTAENVARSK